MMSRGETFLTVVGTYAGYCQVCREPHVVGRIAVPGWPYHGAVCSGCLGHMADEVKRRAQASNADALTRSVADGHARSAILGDGPGAR